MIVIRCSTNTQFTPTTPTRLNCRVDRVSVASQAWTRGL